MDGLVLYWFKAVGSDELHLYSDYMHENLLYEDVEFFNANSVFLISDRVISY